MRTHTVTNGQVSLHTVEEGNPDGPTLILVHGWPDTHALWDRVVPHLADEFRIIRFDNRGAGASAVPRGVADYRLAHLASDLFAVIDSVSPDAPVHLLGHDWGAVLCWEAVCEPDAAGRIASYTSVSGPNLDHLGMWMRRRLREVRTLGPLEQALASAYTVLFQIPGLPVPALRWWFARHWPDFVGAFDRTDPSVIGPLSPTVADDMVHGMKLYRANIRRHLFRPRVRRTDVPCNSSRISAIGRSVPSVTRTPTGGCPIFIACPSTPGTGRRGRTLVNWPLSQLGSFGPPRSVPPRRG